MILNILFHLTSIMKNIIFIVSFLVIIPGVAFPDEGNVLNNSQAWTEFNLKAYRNDPFQWVFPEYFYKADVIPVEHEKRTPREFTRVEFFGLKACVPAKYTQEIAKKDNDLFFKSKTGDFIMMIKSSDRSSMCSKEALQNQKDYCSAFTTPQDYYHKLFTLSPDTARSVGEKWLVHDKGILFEKAKKIEIYTGDHFTAYVTYVKDSFVEKLKFSHSITLFHKNGPLDAHVIITMMDKDDTILKTFLSTLE